MPRALLTLALIVAGLFDVIPSAYPVQPAGLHAAIVPTVLDGDTVEVQLAERTKRLRLIGMNTPQRNGDTEKAAVAQQADQRCFQETGQCIAGVIRHYWEQNGGLPVFGYPITALASETNAEGFTGPTQWFERDRLEDHSVEGKGVLAGRLGAQKLMMQGRPWEMLPKGTPGRTDCVFFNETGHSLCPPFRAYWERNGGLARFGYPISEQVGEANDSGFVGTMQWFERRRMEAHPELSPPYDVLLGLLGREVRGGSMGAPVPPPPPPPPPAGGAIAGQVRFRGAPIGGVSLRLQRCVPDSCITALATVTDSAGNYRFVGAPTLPPSNVYYVQYDNDPQYGNTDDPARLVVWFSRDITAYAAGGSADGGSFDIANVELLTPPDEATVSLPATFTWSRRGIANDRYAVGFAAPDGEELCYSALTEQTSLVVDNAFRLRCEMNVNRPYEWYVYVANGDFTTGFGYSYYYRLVTLSAGQAPPPLPPAPPAPTANPRVGCDAAYPTVCIPSPPPDLNCPQIPFRNFRVLPPDPHNFDGNNDGVGCET